MGSLRINKHDSLEDHNLFAFQLGDDAQLPNCSIPCEWGVPWNAAR